MYKKKLTIECKCGIKIPITSNLEAMTTLIETHANTHIKQDQPKITEHLIAQLLNTIACATE